MIVADTSGLLAAFHRDEPRHGDVVEALRTLDEGLAVAPNGGAHLATPRAPRQGVATALAARRELAGGAYELAQLGRDDLAACADVVERYHDQAIGVADASLVVLAERFSTTTILTLDHRHFDVIRPLSGRRFTIIP